MTRATPLSFAVALLATTISLAACAASTHPAQATQIEAARTPEMDALLRYVRGRGSTGFIVVRDGAIIINQAWRAPDDDAMFANFVYGVSPSGYLLEDVASQQKSFIAVLMAIAVDRGLLDVERSVTSYIGEGWSRASPEQEAAIRVVDIMTMSSGLDEQFRYQAPSGTTFFYNTPVYAVTKRILTAASGESLETITRDWLTVPIGMVETEWRQRPAALASVGNDTGLVTTPLDVARFGQMILNRGMGLNGQRVVSEAQLDALFTPSQTNPAYGRLWWLNSGAYTVRGNGNRRDGPLIPAAAPDTVAALGAFDRRLYVVPSRRLVVVRTGAATNDQAFDQELWLRLNAVLD